MVLNLIPVPHDSDPLANQDDIILAPDAPRTRTPDIREWQADQHDQTIKHVATGLVFRAFPVKAPLVDGLVLSFHRPYDVAVRLVDFPRETDLPSHDRLREIGREGILWVITYTYEASKR